MEYGEIMKEKREILVLTERRGELANTLWSALLGSASAAGVTVAAMGTFFILGGAPVLPGPALAAAAAVLGASAVDFLFKGRSYGTFLCLTTAAALFFSSAPGITREIYAWANCFQDVWNQVFGTFYGGAGLGHVKADMQAAEMVAAFLAAATVTELVHRKSFALLTGVAFAPLCLGLMLSVRLPAVLVAVLLAGWIGVWRVTSGPARIRLETVVLILGTGAALCLLPSAFPGALWQRSAGKFQAHIRQGIEKIRYGEDGLPQGDLMRADQMMADANPRLELEMAKPTSVYLRGYIGATYEENRWKPFSARVYGGEFAGMLSWLAGQGFCPGMQYAGYQDVSGEEPEPELAVSVKNLGASRRYVYLPATASSYSGEKGGWRQDWFMQAPGWFGQKEYGFTYYDAQQNAEVQPPGSWIYEGEAAEEARRFQQAETVYRSFVYSNYLEISLGQKNFIDSVFYQGDSRGEAKGVYNATSRIRTVLRIVAEYEEMPPPVPSGQDFLPWFFQEGKKGNAAYYATAAVLAYRAAGIPARYVEGYVLTKAQAEGAQGKTVVLSGKNAHAWVEAYVDGVGWRTMEVTPGFYEEVYPADIIVAVPNETFDGAGGDVAGILASEEYEYPKEAPENPVLPQEPEGGAHFLALLLLTAALLLKVLANLHRMVLGYRYKRMGQKAKMYFLYGEIMDMMEKLYHNFNPGRPLDLQGLGNLPFDQGLYERTVKRMERVVYGEAKPAPGEVPATEALAVQVQAALCRKLGWRRWIYRYHSWIQMLGR